MGPALWRVLKLEDAGSGLQRSTMRVRIVASPRARWSKLVDESHVRYYSDQEHMLSSGYDVNTLQSAVSCLPNLRGVHIKWSDPANWFKNPPPAWGDAFCNMAKVMGRPDSFIRSWPLNYVREITAVFVACKFASRSLTWFDCEAFELGLLGRDGAEDVYEVDYRGNTVRLTTLDYFVRDRPMDLGFPLVCAIFKSLTSVKLEFSLDESRDYGSCQQHLGTALRGAQGLETLCIQDNSFRTRDKYPLSFTSLLGSSTWPRLKRLSLKCFNIHEHDFPFFFARHPSLHTFTLDEAFANDFDWATLLQSESLASRWRQLHSLTLTGIWGATNWAEPFMKELKARFHYEDYDVPGFGSLNSTFCIWEPFGKWAEDVSGARDSRELLDRCFAAGAGEEGVPFPLRTGQEIVDAVVQEVADGCWFPPSDVMYMLLATERLVGEQHRSRDMFAEYYEDGDRHRSYNLSAGGWGAGSGL
ncbi:hypothetical protein V500_07417 [Pseudogymnoascus sp. VKM F-4518 (FW-2643)]|nr:hypothetical protein V500_07417 [Pseudogymnoascus sp. VKM F-4518 (FW-2643)]